MVATLVKLRFLLLFNSLKTTPLQLIGVAIGALYGLGILSFAVASLALLRLAPVDLARTVVVLVGAVVVLGWTFIPVLTTGLDQTVDPGRLATFPIPINRLLLALGISGVLGVPGIVTSIAALGTVVTWSRGPLPALAALIGAAIGVLTAVVGSRMVAAVASRIGEGRRAREARGLLVLIPLVLLGPIILGVTNLLRDVANLLPGVAVVVGYTPFGAAWAIAADVAAGDFGRAGVELLIALATLAAFTGLWRWGLGRALETPTRPSSAHASKRGLGAFRWLPGTPAGGVAARALTYWTRDPRYAQSLIVVPLVPALLFFYAGLAGDLGALLWVGPLMALLLSLSIYTDISYDNTAFALHLQTGVSGRDDRTGRVVALAVFAVPIALPLTVAGVWVSGNWAMLPGMLGITLGALLSGFAVSSVASARFTFTVPAPGDSPFKARPGGGFGLMLSTFVTWGAVGVLVLPAVALALIGSAVNAPAFGWAALIVGPAVGAAALAFGIRLGGRIMDARGPELLAGLVKRK